MIICCIGLLLASKVTKSCVKFDYGSAFTCVGSVMMISTKVQISWLQREHQHFDDMNEKKKCNYSQIEWKLTSCVMDVKALDIALCVLMYSLSLYHLLSNYKEHNAKSASPMD